jgi:multidrug resistance efflux pump
MSTAIDNFTSQLHDNLTAVEDSPKATLRERAKSLNQSIKSATRKNQTEIQSKLDEAKASLAAKKQEFDEYRAKLKTQFEDKEAEVKSSVDEWKASREVQKLEHIARQLLWIFGGQFNAIDNHCYSQIR